MKMTTLVSFNNMKYYKSKNILTGIAIVLTTLLLFVIPSVGKNLIDIQHTVVNKLYPSWHAIYPNVDADTAKKLALHNDVEQCGIYINVGKMKLDDASVSMISLDETAVKLNKSKPQKGYFPAKENEIVVTKGILEALGQQGDIGDTIHIPYQIYHNGGLDYMQEKDFQICGFYEDSDLNKKGKRYTCVVSKTFAQNEIPQSQAIYQLMIRIKGQDSITTTDIEEQIKNIGHEFGINENDININTEYLDANYVDPVTIPAIIVIMLIVVIAGIITIYSIYYVSINQRVQEFGKLKAIGATKHQIKQIVLREGLCVAAISIPIGLLFGTIAVAILVANFGNFFSEESVYVNTFREVIANKELSIYHIWIYVLAAVVTLCTVYLSLLKPMRTLSEVSEIEAMRYHNASKKTKSVKIGYTDISISRLAIRNLSDNKRKSMVTIVSMAATGVLLIIVATILSCAKPEECANNSLVGQYEISPIIEENNREYPERAWEKIQQNNPLNETLKSKIENLNGVKRVDVFSELRVTAKEFGEDYNYINGVSREYAKELEKGITKGKITYEELKSGDKVILDNAMKHWYPQLDVGTKLNLNIQDGNRTFKKEIEIAAIGNYRSGLSNYSYLYMAKEAVDALSKYNSSAYFHVIADKSYDVVLEQSLQKLIDSSKRLEMRTWQEYYEQWKMSMEITGGACYLFFGILAVISIMNLINTMINSVHVRKKELGMMQAMGMSNGQLKKMLQLEGLFYTLGTLIISIGLGSPIGYLVFLYAKEGGMFEITKYHYPFAITLIISITLLTVQTVLTLVMSKFVQKDSLIERVRFNE